MIEVTLNEVLNSIGAFRSLSEQKIPAKAAFQIARLIRELDKENKIDSTTNNIPPFCPKVNTIFQFFRQYGYDFCFEKLFCDILM